MKLIQHSDSSVGGFGHDDAQYDPIGHTTSGAPVFLVPDDVAEQLTRFQHWNSVFEALDEDGQRALEELHRQERVKRNDPTELNEADQREAALAAEAKAEAKAAEKKRKEEEKAAEIAEKVEVATKKKKGKK